MSKNVKIHMNWSLFVKNMKSVQMCSPFPCVRVRTEDRQLDLRAFDVTKIIRYHRENELKKGNHSEGKPEYALRKCE